MIKKLHKSLKQLFDLAYTFRFIIKLLVLFLLFNLFNYVWIGIAAPGGGVYSPFISHYLNYEVFIRKTCLQMGGFIAGLFGVSSHLSGSDTVRVLGGGYLFMGRPCIGLELFGFWAAFVISDTTQLSKKIAWCLTGWLCIWLINSLRIAILIIAIKGHWQFLSLDQHTLFTTCAYILIFILIFIYYRKNKKQLAV